MSQPAALPFLQPYQRRFFGGMDVARKPDQIVISRVFARTMQCAGMRGDIIIEEVFTDAAWQAIKPTITGGHGQ
ncbi:MAG: hypothetical protein WC205_16890 [Opitutaceae bacterium]|jgi:hypothetical protein